MHPTETRVCAFVLFIILTIIVGIMIVCLTQPKPPGIIVSFYIFDIEIIPNSKDRFVRTTVNF